MVKMLGLLSIGVLRTLTYLLAISDPWVCCRSQTAALVSVDTLSGSFTCSVNLVFHPGDINTDILLGRDWFNYCITGIENAQILLADGLRLVFNGSPFHAVFAETDDIGVFCFYLSLYLSLIFCFMRLCSYN
jgi:hypothetical protein